MTLASRRDGMCFAISDSYPAIGSHGPLCIN